jgi:protoporphyrinogen oxidase
MQQESFDYVVLGGGVSGLGFAKRVSENGKSVLVLEKEAIVGGLSRSVEYKGFYLDYCAHRFHTKNEKLLNEILSLPGLEMKKHVKKSRSYVFGKYVKYPFEVQDLLRAMPVTKSVPAAFSFLWNTLVAKRFKDKKNLRSFEDWFSYIYGYRLYEVMAKHYTAKVWRHDPREISADWADQRLQGEDLVRLLKRIVKKVLTLDFRSYDLKDDSLAPDGGPFWYPMRGIQELPDAMARAAKEAGAKVLASARITRVDTKAKTVYYEHEGSSYMAAYDELISTIPLHTYYHLQDRRNKDVEKALSGLKYMDIIFVFLFLDVPRVSNDHWLYFHDKSIIFNRAVEFSNWSSVMCPPGKTSICFDITSFEGSPEWQMTDDELIERTKKDAVRAKYIDEKHVEDALVVRVKYAYPFYDLDYKQKLDTVVGFLETSSVRLLGRTGIFRYNNSDNSIEMGFELADKMLAGEEASAHTYTVKAVSY